MCRTLLLDTGDGRFRPTSPVPAGALPIMPHATPPPPRRPRGENVDTFEPGRSVALTPPPAVCLNERRDPSLGELALRLLLADGLLPPSLGALLGPTLVDICTAAAPDLPTARDAPDVPA